MKKSVFVAFVVAAAMGGGFVSCDDDSEDGNGSAGVAVDLGLPSGTLWADRNVGASEAADYGWYLAWGETAPKDAYDWITYKYSGASSSSVNKYYDGDGKTTLDLSDDAAHVNWGGKWRMPTQEQFEELNSECTWTWVKDYYGKGVSGFFVEGLNGNSIFLPSAGDYQDAQLKYEGRFGMYWGVERRSDESYGACGEHFYSDYYSTSSHDSRCYGHSVRPVITAE